MNEQPLDVRRVFRAIWRDRVVFFSLLCVALLGALVSTVADPPDYTARALVLLPASALGASGQPTRDIATQVRIASSADVLDIAVHKLRPVPEVTDLAKRVHVTAPTQDILQFDAKGSSRSRAADTANQVAQSYVVYSARGTSQFLDQVVAQLNRQKNDLTTQVSAIQDRIDSGTALLATLAPGSSDAATQTELLDTLRSQLGDASDQLNNIQSQISDVTLNEAVTNSGTHVLEQATTASSEALLVATRNFAIALLLGLLLGAMAAILRDRRDRRLRRRDDIASAAGVPAIASIATHLAHSPEEWLALIASYEPSVDESWGLRRTLRHLVTASETAPARATIMCLAGDADAVAVAPQLATFSARAGLRTVLLVDGRAQEVASLRETPRSTDTGREPMLTNLWLYDSQSTSAGPDHLAPQLVIRQLISHDGRVETAADGDSTTLLAVSAGFATSDDITSISLAATEAGRPLFGVIVANPRTDDDSSGRIPQPVGSMRQQLPTRITGVARSSQ